MNDASFIGTRNATMHGSGRQGDVGLRTDRCANGGLVELRVTLPSVTAVVEQRRGGLLMVCIRRGRSFEF